MTPNQPTDEALRTLLDAACSDTLTDVQFEQLEAALSASEDARREYLRYFTLTGELRYLLSMAHADAAARERTGMEYAAENRLADKPRIPSPETLPGVSFPVGIFQGMVDGLSRDWARAYLLAAVVLGLFLLVASFIHVSRTASIDRAGQLAENAQRMPSVEFVGRISGMKECRWADPRTEAYLGASVPLGRKYALVSGLMQITYDTGAKVILQGPCTYEVESENGGYLSLGKLTARVNTRDEGDSHSPLSPPSSPLFFVRTPTAVITDLGTEFGVEVSKEGNTISHVFRGSVRVEVVGDDFPSPAGKGAGGESCVVLRENESVRVEKEKTAGNARIVLGGEVGTPPKFIRRMFAPPKLLDLLDIVAGGNGTGRRRERGIDPTTGKQDIWLLSDTRISDNEYQPVVWNRFVDGVFAPRIKSRVKNPNVQLDSAGHIFRHIADHKLMEGEWISNNPNGKTIGSIWSRAAEVDPHDRALNTSCWIYNIRDDRRYMPAGRGLLGMHANSGITFDLEAVRKAFDGVRPARFRATAGVADGPQKYEDAIGAVDLWIFIDGRLTWKRMYLRHQDGVVEVNIEIGSEDRFLTVVSTNCRFGFAYDRLVLGDPVLEMVPEEPMDQ